MLSLLKPIHRRFRAQKVRLFLDLLGKHPGTLLDVGGGIGIEGEFAVLYKIFDHVYVVNLIPSGIQLPRVEEIKANGCCLPLLDKSMDWVFSNAVLEHVPGREKQERFAAEIRRVARYGYFVATPNRYFPIDPHSLLPGFQFLPPKWQRRCAPYVPGLYRVYPDDEIHMVSAQIMRSLFPEATVYKMGFPGWSNNLVAAWAANGRSQMAGVLRSES